MLHEVSTAKQQIRFLKVSNVRQVLPSPGTPLDTIGSRRGQETPPMKTKGRVVSLQKVELQVPRSSPKRGTTGMQIQPKRQGKVPGEGVQKHIFAPPTVPNHYPTLTQHFPTTTTCLIYMVSGGTCRQTSGSNICTFHFPTVTFVQTFKPAMIPDTYRLTQTLQARASTVTLQ